MSLNHPDSTLKPFILERTLQAPRALVFDVWTQKEHLAKWFGPKGVTLYAGAFELKPGGVFHYSMTFPGSPTAMWGKWTFKEVIRPERIVLLSSFSDEKGGITRHPMSAEWPLETLSTTTFTEHEGATRMRLEWLPYQAKPNEIAAFNRSTASMEGGWAGTFEALKAYVETLVA